MTMREEAEEMIRRAIRDVQPDEGGERGAAGFRASGRKNGGSRFRKSRLADGKSSFRRAGG